LTLVVRVNSGQTGVLSNTAVISSATSDPVQGNNSGTAMTIVINTIAPTVTAVTSTTANGSYGVGSVITITLGWSTVVVVTGTPQLVLNSGGTASYSSGSGTSTLTFTYTVAAGENSPDLDYTSTSALTLNGGTILDTVNTNPNAGVLTLPAPGSAGSIGGSKSIVIDTTAPTVTAVTSTIPNGAYGVGSVITITVGWSEPVVVTGTPQLALNSGGTARYSSGSGTNTLTFTYTVAAGQNSPGLDYTSTGALSLNGGAIFDTVTTNPDAAVLALPAPGSAGSIAGSKSIVIPGVGGSAELAIVNSGSPNPVISGTDLTYTLTVYTSGPSDARDVSVSDPLPTGTSFVSASGGGEFKNGTVTWQLGTFAAGAPDATLKLVVRVDDAQTADLVNTAFLSSSTSDPVSDNNRATAKNTVMPASSSSSVDLSVKLGATPNIAVVNQNLTYTLTVTNAGPGPATGVILTQTLPEGTTFVSATGGVLPVNGKLTFQLGNLAPGSAAVTVVVRPIPGTATLATKATVNSNEPNRQPGNSTAPQDTVVMTPPGSGPRIVGIRRFGFQRQPTLLVLYTKGDGLDPVRAANTLNYKVTSAGKDGVFGTIDDVKIAVRSVIYYAPRKTVTLAFDHRLQLYRTYHIRVNSASRDGLADTSGRLLDGDADSKPGGDYKGAINRSNLAGRASQATEPPNTRASRAMKPMVKFRVKPNARSGAISHKAR
jgi:large repetitive protein